MKKSVNDLPLSRIIVLTLQYKQWKVNKSQYIWLAVIFIFLSLCGCGNGTDAVHDEVDSLNMAAYHAKYASLTVAKQKVDEAFAKASAAGYTDGVHEALLHRGDVFGMSMRYDSAKWCYEKVLSQSNNDLMRSLADVDMMSVCLMLSMSKEFYDYRGDALERFANLREVETEMNPHQFQLWKIIQAQYHFVSVNYFMKMRQVDGIRSEAEWLENNQELFQHDVAQNSCYLFLSSLLGLNSSRSDDAADGLQRSLVRLLSLSRQNGNVYFEASALNSLAKSILSVGELKPSRKVFVEELVGEDMKTDNATDIAIRLAKRAERLAMQYGNDFVRTTALVTLSDAFLQQGKDSLSLAHMDTALNLINQNHRLMNPLHPDVLYLYTAKEDTLSTEMRWILNSDVVAIPDWMAMVREQLSVVYGAMGMKAESDYNHNVYFDILDATRQDQRVLQEEDHLNYERRILNVLLWLLGVTLVTLVWVVYLYNRKTRRVYREKVEMLARVVDLCKKLASVLSEEPEDEEDLDARLHGVADDEVSRLFPAVGSADWTRVSYQKQKGLDGELLHVLQVFFQWVRQRGILFMQFAEEGQQIESEMYVLEKKFEENKRQYIEKLTSMSMVNGITPFLNRALHEVSKLTAIAQTDVAEVRNRLVYLGELVDKINEYNDVLGHWVKVRQGLVTLHVESFSLQPLFETMRRGSKTFSVKGVELQVDDTDSVVKADKALTLFMMNTLLDNARKYTPEGGSVSLCASETDDYVEISVQDTGHGLSQEDVDTLNHSKVYDSTKIGVKGDGADAIRRQKGFGFGLMNCKGIIGKYKKTNALFHVCDFGVESTPGIGSRFYFRLPKGILKAALLMLLLFQTVGAFAESHLSRPEVFADSVYSSNVEGRYAQAVIYADSAIRHLNESYHQAYPHGKSLMTLEGPGMAELDWWRNGESADYDLIMRLRNEVAIAALALNRNRLYHYNSEVLTRLYTLTSTDLALEDYCNEIRQANKDKKTLVLLLGFLVLGMLVTFFFMHYRHHQLFIFNLRQFIQLNSKVFSVGERDFLPVLKQNLSDIKPTDVVALMLPDEGNEKQLSVAFEGYVAEREGTEALMRSAYQQGEEVVSSNGHFYAYPLTVPGAEVDVSPVGVMGVRFSDNKQSAEEHLIVDLVRQFVSIHSYFSRLKVGEMNDLLEEKREERVRLEAEQQHVYVRNQIMDNCLSALKHETMYYPSRIKQLVDSVLEQQDVTPDAKTIQDIDELLSYYKDIFTILSSCAGKQVEQVLFKRTTLSAQTIGEMAMRAFNRQQKKQQSQASFSVSAAGGLTVQGDKIYLQTLVDHVVSIFFEHQSGGDLHLSVELIDGFVNFAFIDSRYRYADEDTSQLFYVDHVHYDSLHDRLDGAYYLLCRQIIREHDAYASRRGCRIYVENLADGMGSRFVFTLPHT